MTLFSNVPSAASVDDADYVLGLQGSTGPGTGNTAKMTLQQIVNLVGTGPFSSLSVTGNASIGGTLTLSGNPTTALQAATKQYADLMLPLAGGTMTGALAMGGNALSGSAVAFTGGSVDGVTIGGTTPGASSFIRGNSNAAGNQLQIALGTSADSVANNWLWGRMRWTGTCTGAEAAADSQISANKVIFTDAGIITSSGGSAGALYAMQTISGNTDANNTAARGAFQSRIIVGGQIGPTPTLGVGVSFHACVSSLSTGYATASQGGLGGWTAGNNPSLGYYRGALFGGNDNIWTTTGASNWYHLIGREIDVGIKGTSNVYDRIGLLVVSTPSTAQADGDDDTAIAITTTDTAGFNWKNGITFGITTGEIQVSGALIKVMARQYPSPETPAFVDGIDFTQGTFSGKSIKTPGFSVDGNGNISALSVGNGATALQVAGAGSWSANGSVATSLTSIGPTGSHTTVQEWFTVKNASGVTRYIPAF